MESSKDIVKKNWCSEGNFDKLISTLKQAVKPGSNIILDIEVDEKSNIKFGIKEK